MKRFILTSLALLACSHLAYGQAKVTASRTGDLQVGGGFVADFPDYTRHKFYGYFVYADLDIGEHFGIEGEFRQAHDTTTRIGGGGNVPQYQRNYEGGLRYHRTYRDGKLQPYAKMMYGYGVIQFPPFAPPASQAISEGSAGYSFVAPGGGIDYHVTSHVTIRADMEYQLWFSKISQGLGFDFYTGTGGIPNGLTPIVYNGGVAWRFGSGRYTPHGGNHGLY